MTIPTLKQNIINPEVLQGKIELLTELKNDVENRWCARLSKKTERRLIALSAVMFATAINLSEYNSPAHPMKNILFTTLA